MQRAATVAPSGPAPFSFTDGDRICDCPGLWGGAVCDTDVPAKTALAAVFSAVAVAGSNDRSKLVVGLQHQGHNGVAGLEHKV